MVIDKKRSLPLSERAWTYQDRIVSPGVVYFAHTELAWECNETADCECGRLRKRVDYPLETPFERVKLKSEFKKELRDEHQGCSCGSGSCVSTPG